VVQASRLHPLCSRDGCTTTHAAETAVRWQQLDLHKRGKPYRVE